jgi:CBS domain-containing protein
MKIKEILEKKGKLVITVRPDDRVCDTVKTFSEKKIGSGVVVDDKDKVIGIFTERDALRCFKDVLDFGSKTIKDLMTPYDKLIIASPEDDIQYVMAMMTEHRIKHIPIIEDTKLAGIVSIGDVVKAQLIESKQITKKYLDYIGDIPHPENDQY